jgi:hypothetical protein
MVGLVASGPEVETFVLGKMAFEGQDMRRDTILKGRHQGTPPTSAIGRLKAMGLNRALTWH